jgi:hypothetical protein
LPARDEPARPCLVDPDGQINHILIEILAPFRTHAGDRQSMSRPRGKLGPIIERLSAKAGASAEERR